ncbi:MAG: ABC transporter permease DevC [Planctomycetota bacterium]|nr:ABC transporter permease DevC [Planctomycetota bacterium]
MKTPIAWRNLTHNKRKLLVAVSGVAFAVTLMFQQTGFENALFDSTVEIVKQTDCDIVIFNRARFALSSELRFKKAHLDRASGVKGVEMTTPLYIDNTVALFHAKGFRPRPIRVVGTALDQQVFLAEEIRHQLDLLKQPDSALIDRLSKPEFGYRFDGDQLLGPREGELMGKPIELVGTFRMGRDFAHEGNLIMSDRNFSRYFGYRGLDRLSSGFDPLSLVDLGLIRATDGVSPSSLKEEIIRALPAEVTVMTRAEFVEREIAFWSASTPIGIIFKIGAAMGFVVGIIICYQILATDIADHISELATLKAMGYSDNYFRSLIISESLILSLLGFLPGLLFSLLIFEINAQVTGLIMLMTIPRAALILGLTIVMCLISGLIAMRKLLTADPASLF